MAQGVGGVFAAEHVEPGDLRVGGRQTGRVADAGQGGVGGVPGPPTALQAGRSPDSARLRQLRGPRIQRSGLARPEAGTGRPAGLLAGYPVTRSAR
jgi:hypothetical protein